MINRREFIATIAAGASTLKATTPAASVRSQRSGPWSSTGTWEGNQLPVAGSVVEIAAGHKVIYDLNSDHALRMVHVLGHLSFARDRDTRLDVGLLKIGGDAVEDGAVCALHHHSGARPTLDVGTPDEPVGASHSARIRLVYFEGFDKDTLPALMCCGGRMEFHGAPLSRTWLKLGARVKKGDIEIALEEAVTGWRAGDRVILTATRRQTVPDDTFTDTVTENTQTEERIIAAIGPAKITLDKPVKFDHVCDGPYRGEVANLSRNVIVESAAPEVQRGHTMYHHGSAGSISYAEFRHLGKEGVLGRYTLHFHQVRDSMRGSSVIGASIWDSGNRWITVHGTDYLVVRDCVGYNSVGHGFFLEDGTEVYNVFDRNLAVQGRTGKILKGQILPFDHNSGSGFWWANNLNTFTRNVACECDVYGFRFDMQKTKDFDPVLAVPKLDGSRQTVDVRTLPFVRFEDNEAHCQRNFALNIGGLDINLGGGAGGVGPDVNHPLTIRNTKVWDCHWSFHTLSPCVMLENYDIHDCAYGMWKPTIVKHVYRNVHMEKISAHVLLDGKGELPEAFAGGEVGPAKLFDLKSPAAGTPDPLKPIDDLAPVVIATYVGTPKKGRVTIRGTASDNGKIRSLIVNGQEAHSLRSDFAQWEVSIQATNQPIIARAVDAANNISSTKLA